MCHSSYRITQCEIDSLFARFDTDQTGMISVSNLRPFFEDDVATPDELKV